jgi:predicted nucleic acid-binding protein
MAWCFEDEADRYADSVLDALASSDALVPPVWALEVGNVLLVAERRKRLKKADSIRFVELLAALPIRVDGDTRDRALGELLSLAREHRLSSYDGSYLELAMRAGVPLATRDRSLRRACRKSGVPLFSTP